MVRETALSRKGSTVLCSKVTAGGKALEQVLGLIPG